MISLFYSLLTTIISSKILSFWVIINGLVAFYIRKQIKPYYCPKYVKKYKRKNLNSSLSLEKEQHIILNNQSDLETKDKILNENYSYETVNIHDEYPEFKRYDKLPSFIFMWISMSTYMWIKGCLWILFLSIIWLDCKISFGSDKPNNISSKEKRLTMQRIMRWYCGIGFYFFGCKIIERKHIDEVNNSKEENDKALNIYKKYLGPDYTPDNNHPYSVIITNHTGWVEIQYCMYKYAPGFISKIENYKIPFVGRIADYLDTLWLDRDCVKSREETAKQLKKRQQDFMDGKVLSPLIVFPEGTTSSGKYIIKLRKGTFDTLSPLKPILFKYNSPMFDYDIAQGIMSLHLKAIPDFAIPFHVVNVLELPVIYPTEYMFNNYKNKSESESNKELSKGEIYANVVQDIWCEIGDFKKSNKSFSDYRDYNNIIEGKSKYIIEK